jgi:DNA (cytosine-5)-methyltransferase 1
MVRVLDLYCGMGGLSLGFALALRSEIMGLDIDKWAVETYNLNLARFGCRAIVQDIFKWEANGDFDIIIGGSPCQPFSVANITKRGEDHPLFPTLPKFYDVVSTLKPEAFVMENVKGLITKTSIHYLTQQLSKVQDYHIKQAILNAADYGVPQKRERLIVVGIRKDLSVDFEFPEPTHAQKENANLKKWVTLREAIGDIMYGCPINWKQLTQTLDRKQEEKNFGKTIFLINSNGEIVEKPWTRYQEKHPPLNLDRPARTLLSHVSSSYREFLIPIMNHAKVGYIYRKLTVRECLRIQSFPDWWKFPEKCSISKRYKLVGEAVPPILAYRLAEALGQALGLEVKSVTKEDFLLPYFDRVFYWRTLDELLSKYHI